MPPLSEIIQTLTVYAIPVLLAITLHEAAHAYAAKIFGDNTAYSMGRMSLNPVKHIDPFGTILMPIVLYIGTGGAFLFGYAKPVPVNIGQLRNPRSGMAWVAIAGPLSNFVMALLWALLGIVILPLLQVQELFLTKVAHAGILVNLVMFALNLLPIPPLDGGRVLVSILPYKWSEALTRIEPYGFFIVLALSLLHLLSYWMMPLMTIGGYLINLMLMPVRIFM